MSRWRRNGDGEDDGIFQQAAITCLTSWEVYPSSGLFNIHNASAIFHSNFGDFYELSTSSSRSNFFFSLESRCFKQVLVLQQSQPFEPDERTQGWLKNRIPLQIAQEHQNGHFPHSGNIQRRLQNIRNIIKPQRRTADQNRAKRTFSRTSAPKFLSAATFTHTHPSFSPAVGTLYVALGTAETTTSERARQRARSNSGGAWRTTWCGWNARRGLSPVPADAAGRLVYSWIESMSTEKTRAPSFARSAASGRPTTSDLGVRVCGCG